MASYKWLITAMTHKGKTQVDISSLAVSWSYLQPFCHIKIMGRRWFGHLKRPFALSDNQAIDPKKAVLWCCFQFLLTLKIWINSVPDWRPVSIFAPTPYYPTYKAIILLTFYFSFTIHFLLPNLANESLLISFLKKKKKRKRRSILLQASKKTNSDFFPH